MNDPQEHQNDEEHVVMEIKNHHKNDCRTPVRSRSHSRCHTRSRSPEQTKPWKSVNPFINFMQDFRQRFPDLKSTNILRLGGEEWRNMSITQKQPYIDAAKVVRVQKRARGEGLKNQQKQEKQQRQMRQRGQRSYPKQQNWQNITNDETKKYISDLVPEKLNDSLEEQNKKNKKVKRHASDAATDCSNAGTSGTAGSLTSEDLSDISS